MNNVVSDPFFYAITQLRPCNPTSYTNTTLDRYLAHLASRTPIFFREKRIRGAACDEEVKGIAEKHGKAMSSEHDSDSPIHECRVTSNRA
jgi:hypothetical protein